MSIISMHIYATNKTILKWFMPCLNFSFGIYMSLSILTKRFYHTYVDLIYLNTFKYFYQTGIIWSKYNVKSDTVSHVRVFF